VAKKRIADIQRQLLLLTVAQLFDRLRDQFLELFNLDLPDEDVFTGTPLQFGAVVSEFLILAEIMGIDIEKAVWGKYPRKCPYCDRGRCDCGEHKRNPPAACPLSQERIKHRGSPAYVGKNLSRAPIPRTNPQSSGGNQRGEKRSGLPGQRQGYAGRVRGCICPLGGTCNTPRDTSSRRNILAQVRPSQEVKLPKSLACFPSTNSMPSLK